MEEFYIAPGVSTPEIGFKANQGILFFHGKSYPTNPEDFYQPVFTWLKSFLKNRKLDNKLQIIFRLEYYNTSTSKQFAKLFRLLEENQMHDNVSVCWYYQENDTDMLEAGQRFSQYTRLKFDIQKYSPN